MLIYNFQSQKLTKRVLLEQLYLYGTIAGNYISLIDDRGRQWVYHLNADTNFTLNEAILNVDTDVFFTSGLGPDGSYYV